MKKLILFIVVLFSILRAEDDGAWDFLDVDELNPFSRNGEFRLSADNDVFFSQDQDYTHGTALSYSYEVNPYKHWLLKKEVSYHRLTVGQYMYTPSDISISELQEDERPYGGLLYLDFTTFIQSDDRQQSLSILGGTVGKNSLASGTQTWVHKKIDATEPMGWDNQIHNELIINLSYYDRHRIVYNKYFDLLGRYGSSLGNLNTNVAVGTTFKFGYNVLSDFDILKLEPYPRKIDIFPSNNVSFYGFLSLEGRIVGHNIFLDGNTFRDSHSVQKEYLVGDIVTGINLRLYNFDVIYSLTFRSKEYEMQENSVKFGSLSLGYRW